MSGYFYSAKNGGFYHSDMKPDYETSPDGWPEDATEVSDDDYNALMAGQEKGQIITADSAGNPVLAFPVTDWQARAESERQSLLTEGNSITADWRTELELGVISEEDKITLTAWMIYIKSVKKLDLSGVSTEEGYNDLVWPETPDVA